MLQAFDVLERLDPTPQMYEAKRGAAVGAFQLVVAGKEEVRGLGPVTLRIDSWLHCGVLMQAGWPHGHGRHWCGI